MNISSSSPEPNWAINLKETFRQIQEEAILFSVVGLAIGGTVLLACSSIVKDARWTVGSGLLAFGLAILGWLLRQRSFLLVSCILAAGLTGLVGFAVWWGQIELALIFLILPVGFLTLTLDARRGFWLTGFFSVLLLFAPNTWLPASSLVRAVTLVAIWCVLGMIWLTLRPLLQAVQWAWSGYLNSLASLQQAREFQAQLQQSLNELRETNIQMVRLNQLTQNLRMIAENERRVKEEFVANVSHELRTPLNMIIGFSEMILNSPETYGAAIPATLLADLEVILRNSQHLSSLIDDVLDLSQIDAGRMALSREWVDFQEIVQDAVLAVRPLVESKNLWLRLEIPDDLPKVWCDRIRIREVLLNLLSNAGRFTEQGGITVCARVDGRYLVVSVRDTGPGIPQEDTNRLFQPFQQLDSSIRRRYGGTGLGLSISKGFVELHEGEMGVESRKGEGTTFFFKIPLQPLELPLGGPTRWLHPYQLREDAPHGLRRVSEAVKASLVVVEKGNVLQKLLHRYLPQVEVIPASNLEAGLELVERQHAVALLINDEQAGVIAEELKKNQRLPFNIPAIVCTIPGIDQAGAELGAVQYLVKPIDRRVLLETLERLGEGVETILVVDDESDARQLFRRMLASADRKYRVVRASNGLEALDKLRQQQIDVILLDLVMPVMDGFQFLAEKNSDPQLRSIPVILISARDPFGHPIASNALTLIRSGGISMKQVIASVEAILAIAAPLGEAVSEPSAVPAD